MGTHEIFMRRCLHLARAGLGTTYPNPLVGCVIVHNGRIIGEGWHKKAGEGHAEVNAIDSVADKSLLKEATIYVSLEPCSHFGKTPPCADLIIRHGIPNAVIGTVDPNEKVAGNGIAKLNAAGINTVVGVLDGDCRSLNKRFFTFQNKKRPYIILKWAQTANGFIAPKSKNEAKPVWITNAYSRQLVHKWRTEEHAILIGAQTAIDDNPELTARDWAGNHPVRIVIDRSHRIPQENHIFDNQARTIVLSDVASGQAETQIVDFTGDSIKEICRALWKCEIQSVIVEGGAQTLQGFIDAGLWDEARVFKGQISIASGIKAPAFGQQHQFRETILGDELLTYHNYDQHDYF